MACHPNLPSLAPHRRDPPPPVVSGQRMRQGRCWIRKFNVDAVIIDDDDDDDDDGDDDDIAVTYLHRWWRVLTHVTVMYGISWEPSTATITPRRLRRVCKKFNARNALHRWNLWLERLVIIIAVMKDLKEVQQHFNTELTSQMRKMEQQLIYQICILQPQPWNIHCSIWFVESLEKFN